MHDHPSPSALQADKAQREYTVLALLLEPGASWPWSVKEIAQATGDDVLAFDAIESLHAAGLVHRSREFVFPTRAAARFREIERGAI